MRNDPGLNRVEWRDLLQLTPRDTANEVLLSVPWLLGSWIAIAYGWWIVALACSFMFFLTGLRQVHNAYHHSVGLPPWGDHAMMLVLSVLMLGSMHAVCINHLRHHRYCMREDDVEAMGARLPWWGAILLGPRYPWSLHTMALKVASTSQRRWIVLELLLNALWIVAVFLWFDALWLQYHVIAMAVGQCFTAFFAVWTTHHDCDGTPFIARSIRNRFKSLLAYDMFYHFEHHTWPAVPTCKLHVLAARLDEAHPDHRPPLVY